MSDIKDFFKEIELGEYELDKKYPDRHTTIHKVCCERCPSNKHKLAGTEDPESKEIKDMFPKSFIVNEFLFVCAWRNSKLCKGNCDYFEIDEDFINATRSKNIS